MSLIKSISGIRGTIGGKAGDNLTPVDIVKFAAAYGSWLKENSKGKKVVVGRDGRISGMLVQSLVINTLNSKSIDVIDLGLSTTPTVEMAVQWENADGGIIITASHNPKEWNALKLLNNKGEFISGEEGNTILKKAEEEQFTFSNVNTLGLHVYNNNYLQQHIDAVVNYTLVDKASISERAYTVVVDTINSSGALAVPPLLYALGIKNVIILNEEITGDFAHNPEPLPEHLTELSKAVVMHKADFGIAVDPDVDRLCFVCEDGSMFGEEYTLVAVADYILSKKKGATVSNMSSTKGLKEITIKHGCTYFASAVGEVNVVSKMKAVHAVIGGEGNGGIIVPDFHYGRDALIGIGLFLTALSKHDGNISMFRKQYPFHVMSKNKIDLQNGVDIKDLFDAIQSKYDSYPINKEDGLKIEFKDGWVHLRTSNTEPIIRIYAESISKDSADELAGKVKQEVLIAASEQTYTHA